jgi:glycosyltransferase involved in cell wall biosynthesis
MKPLVTIITPTTGASCVKQAIASVQTQTYDNIQHIVVVDGPTKTNDILDEALEGAYVDLIKLPYATGKDQYNGHRIYGAMSYIAKGDFLCFLDQDNWFEKKHIEELVKVINAGNQWSYSLRRIVNQEGNFICNDDCESLGKWTSVINDNFIDVNCYMIPKQAALAFSPYWYRRARHPQEQPEVDRILSPFMMQNFKTFSHTYEYSVNYRVASREDSVQGEFFLKGNQVMINKYEGKLPWRKKI